METNYFMMFSYILVTTIDTCGYNIKGVFVHPTQRHTPPKKYHRRSTRFAENPLGKNMGTVIERRLLLR